MRWLVWLGAIIAAVAIGFTAWLYLLGPWRAVDMDAQAPPLQPALSADPSAWQNERAGLLSAFERDVYGAMPAPIAPVVADRVEIAAADAGGVERVEQWRVEVGAAGHFNMTIARPEGDAPAPVIIVFNFCGNRAAFPGRPTAIAEPVGYVQEFCNYDRLDPLVENVFGRYVNGPPFDAIIARGYAVALVYPGDIVPDREAEARAALARFAPPDTGAVMAWAWTASRALDVLAADPRFDAGRIALFGHSRHGKAALVAGAFDPRFSAIVALQSGRGGDAPTRMFEGESVTQIMGEFPFWFSPRFGEPEPSVEQHQLLALIAPRAVLLAHARRDGWADPVGARATRDAAAPIYAMLGAEPPAQFMRGGGHGIHASDWDATLNFLDARMR